jgi:hypothetical protein
VGHRPGLARPAFTARPAQPAAGHEWRHPHIGWQRTPDHLASTASEYAGFVPLQGAASHAEHTITLTGGDTTRKQGGLAVLCAAPVLALLLGLALAEPSRDRVSATRVG